MAPENEIVRRIPEVTRLARYFARRGGASDADDLIGAGLLGLVKAASSWRGEAYFWNYAKWIVKGEILNYIRKTRTGADWRYFSGVEIVPVLFASKIGVREQSFARAQCHEILDELSPRERKVIWMRAAGGYSLKEVGGACGLSVRATAWIYSRAKKTIRERNKCAAV